MHGADHSLLVHVLVAIQVIGLLAAFGARLSVGSRHQGKCQWTCVALLGLVGIATIISLSIAPWLWLLSGACLAVMVLAATCDFRRSNRATAW